MKTIETNIFPISGLAGHAAAYEIFHVNGMSPEHDEYHENCHRLQRNATRQCDTAAIVLKRPNGPILAMPVSRSKNLPASIWLTRAQATFAATGETIQVDFGGITPETEILALRYLQSAVRDSLRLNNGLWQPDARNVFFEKHPVFSNHFVGMYRGFGVTVARIPTGGFGLAIDVQFKFISLSPLKSRLNEQEFKREHKMHTFVYHYGDIWYEVQLANWTALEAAAYRCGESGGRRSLLSWMHDQCEKPLPAEIAHLDKAGNVLEYVNADGETRGVPAQLCYRMFDSQAPEIQQVHRRATRVPGDRHWDIVDVVRKHFGSLRFGSQAVTVNTSQWKAPLNRIDPPDIKFGGSKILSVHNTLGTIRCDISSYGRMRLKLLEDRQAGFYTRTGLCRQYLFLPKTVENTWGPLFAKDFVNATNELYAQESGYVPTIVYYDDTAARNFIEHADAINLKASALLDGYAVVMLAEPKVKTPYREDELAGCAADRLAKHNIIPAFIHATSAQSFFSFNSHERRWEVRRDRERRYSGYLRLAAINKVMLTARQWPFVLGTRLHADVTVGIDVKGSTAGFTAVCPSCSKVWSETTETKRKERMSRRKCREMIVLGITRVANAAGLLPSKLVVQRDGRMFEPEIEAAKDAIVELKASGIIAADATLTCVEIPKSGSAPFRLFEEYTGRDGLTFQNPEYGTYCITRPTEAFVCNTGRSFGVPGSVRPLHLKRVFGEMPMLECVEDVFYLSCLTWSQPEGCSRHPVTVRLNDRQLIDVATPFDDEDDEAPVTAMPSEEKEAR